MTRTQNNPWLHRFAVLTVLATLCLIGIGGLVTSHGAGMAVPDWPTSYGYNMFALPFRFWKGGVFYEHTHRLWASGVGMLTVILAVWLWLKESRAWMRWLGVIAVVSVVLQGVLGGLRVVLFKDEIGIVHAALAQLFLVLVCVIALMTSRWWRNLGRGPLPRVFNSENEAAQQRGPTDGVRRLFLATTILLFLQLIIGAAMRHQHAGLAIRDFPLAYGALWPDMGADAVARYNAQRFETAGENPITAFQIGLQMAHRAVAGMILVAVAGCAWRAWRKLGWQNPLAKLSAGWLVLIFSQALLGAATIWSNKAADIATAHVVVGALSLVMGSIMCLLTFRGVAESRVEVKAASFPDLKSDLVSADSTSLVNSK